MANSYTYRIKQGSIIKIGGIPVELLQDIIVECGTDLLEIDDISLDNIDKYLNSEWINLKILKDLNSI